VSRDDQGNRRARALLGRAGRRLPILLGAAVLLGAPAASAQSVVAEHSLRAPLTGETIYHVVADRFANGTTENDLGGLPLEESGFDPAHKGFFHGGDLEGIRQRLPYIRGLGTTAIRLAPSFKSRPLQPLDGSAAGYHGRWVTDFTQIDPHLGTNADLVRLVDEAHALGMKVFLDAITNHTADVIDHREGSRHPYVSKDERPYLDASGEPFDDRNAARLGVFPALDAELSFPLTPFETPGAESLKAPWWLNEVTLYHNRGEATAGPEATQYGDLQGLDDLFTEHPRVVEGMVEIYTRWIRDFGIDGFALEDAERVDDGFWRRFAPEVLEYARSQGKLEFFMFGRVFDTGAEGASHFTTQARMQAVEDARFRDAAAGFAAGSRPTDDLRDLFVADDWFTDADSNAYQLATVLGSADAGRIGTAVRSARPDAGDAELLARDRLAHELMFLSRGNPGLEYGDEQGFTGDGTGDDARQDMFGSLVPSYNDDDLIGTDATTAGDSFDAEHPLYRAIGELSALTRRHPALGHGAQQHRWSSGEAGIYAFSRLDAEEQHEYVVALNNAGDTRTAEIPTYLLGSPFELVYGTGPGRLESGDDRRLAVTVPPLSAVVYRAAEPLPQNRFAPSISLGEPGVARGRAEIGAHVGGEGFAEVTFLAMVGERGWSVIGTDDNAPYRVFHDVADLDPGTHLRYRAVVLDNAGHLRPSAIQATTVATPAIAMESPEAGATVSGRVPLRAAVTPPDPAYAVTFQRQVGDGPWEAIATDRSPPEYTVVDDVDGLPAGTVVRYRAELVYQRNRTVVSDVRAVVVGLAPNAIAAAARADPRSSPSSFAVRRRRE
jgi:alpha-amylase